MRHHRTQARGHRPRPLFIAGVLLLLCGLALYAWQGVVRYSYRRLAMTLGPAIMQNRASVAQEDSVSWPSLREHNDDLVAWLAVEGTDINHPVVSSSSKPEGFYLTHDLWGRWALEGTPFLDVRCDANGQHRLVYGHHLSAGGQFSQLQKAYEQARFDQLGLSHWCTPTQSHTTFVPLLAARVHQSFAPIQTFTFSDNEALHAWLRGLVSYASAVATDWQHTIETATSALTLVTCSSEWAGQPWRTIVVFIELDEDIAREHDAPAGATTPGRHQQVNL